MKMFSVEYFNKKAVEEIKKLDGVYYSESEDSFAVTDRIMEELIKRYNITENEDLAEPEFQDKYNFTPHIYTGIEQFIDYNYDGEDVEYFDKTFYFTEYSECVEVDYLDRKTDVISFPDGVDWAEEIKKALLKEVSIGLQIRLEEELNKAVDEGFSLDILKNAFDNAEIRKDYITKQAMN